MYTLPTHSRPLCVTTALVVLAGSAAAFGQCGMTKLVHNDRQASDFIGGALSVSTTNGGALVAAGMGADDAAHTNSGSVRFFQRISNVWGEMTNLTLTPTDPQANDFFGTSVDYSDPVLIVGATGVGDTGAAYIYRRFGSLWDEEAKIVPPGSALGDDVGRSVAISGDWAIIGAPLKDLDESPNAGMQNPNTGVAYFYHRVGGVWTLADTMEDADQWGLGSDDHLGSAVAISGDVAVIGVPDGERVNWPDNHGYVHIYRRNAQNEWVNDASQFYLTSNNAQADDDYGAAVAVSSDARLIAIGAPRDDATAAQLPDIGSAKTDSGCVYIQWYDTAEDSWYIDGQLFASDASDNARFGSSVAIENGRVIVGCEGSDKVYVFRRLGQYDWAQEAVYSDPDGPHSFGSAVAFDGSTVFIGDETDNAGNLVSGGALYVASLSTNSHDSCEGAVALPNGSGQYPGCTTNATLNGVTTCGYGGSGQVVQGPDVWFSWTPSCSGNVIVDTFGSDIDTVLSVHTACPGVGGGSNTLTCNDDGFAEPNRASLVTFNYTAGTTYLLRVASYGGQKGEFVLRVVDYAAPANDACANATDIGNGAFPFKTCAATTAGPLLDTLCSGNDMVKDVWFEYTSPISGAVKVNTCGSNFDTMLAVYSGAACPGVNAQPIVCDDDGGSGACGDASSTLTFGAVAGGHYLIRVGGFPWQSPSNLSAGEGVLTVTTALCACDWDQSGTINVADIFAFLASWFAGNGDFDGQGGNTVADIFTFLSCWFGGCQ